MTAMAHPAPALKKAITREEVLALQALPENMDKTIELIQGELSIMTGGSILHTLIISRLIKILSNFLDVHPLGIALTDGAMYDLPNGDLVIPDGSFLSNGRYVEGKWPTRFALAPDLAIEVVSPSNSPDQISKKINAYLSAGVRLVWVIYPTPQILDGYASQADGQIYYQHLTLTDVLTGGDVLPEFGVEVRQIFPFIEQ